MRFLLVLALTGIAALTVCEPAKAQWWESKWEISPFAGYETNGTFTVRPSSISPNVTKLRANGNYSFGSFIDYSLTSNAQLDFMWNRNPTTYSEQLSPTTAFTKAYHSNIDQFQFGVLYMLLGSEHKVRPYIAGGLGFAHEFNTGGTPNRTDFSYNLGGGVKYFVDRHFGFRGDGRWMPTYANSSPAIYCDLFGCYSATVRNYQHRGNFVGGLVFRF